MPNRLYVVHGSHPCATVEKALQLKGISYKTVEITPSLQPALMKLRFGGRTVPGIRFEDGEKVQGSRAILRRLEERVPEPALYPQERRAEIEEAERWGDEVLQSLVRRILWLTFGRHPRSMHAYQEGQRLPKLPVPMILAVAPGVLLVERKLNGVTEEAVRQDLGVLPGHLDRIDGWIAAGVLGGEEPNAADLQIATSLRLLSTIGDVRPLIDGRPAATLAPRWFDELPASTPPGLLPAEWIPQPAPA